MFLSSMSRLLFRWGGFPLLAPCVPRGCDGNKPLLRTSDSHFSILLHSLASVSPAQCCPIYSYFFLLSCLTVLWPGSVLGCPSPGRSTSWGRRRWRGLSAPGCDSQQGTEPHQHFLFFMFQSFHICWPKTVWEKTSVWEKLLTLRDIVSDKCPLLISIFSISGSRASRAAEPGPDWRARGPLLTVLCQFWHWISGWGHPCCSPSCPVALPREVA